MRNSAMSLALVTALTVAGCAHVPPAPVAQSPAPIVVVKPFAPPPEASLMQPCPDLPMITDGSSAGVTMKLIEVGTLYAECAARHAALIVAIKKTTAAPGKTLPAAKAKPVDHHPATKR